LSNQDTTKLTLELLIIKIQERIKLSNYLNYFYISEDKETLYIIKENCLELFNILNKNILKMVYKLPLISDNTDNITLNNNILTENSTITNENTNNYISTNKVKIFKFNGNDFTIDINEINNTTVFTLDGNIEDWYYIICSNYITLVYITLEDSKKFNQYFLKYKTSFKIDLQRVYKILYKNNNDDDSNRGFKCIYKDIFEITDEHKLIKLLTNKIIKIYHCTTYNNVYKIFNYNPTKDFKENIKIIFPNYTSDYFNQLSDYDTLYISEDETILYYIQGNCIDNFNVLNKSILEVLDKMPNIEYSRDLSTRNKSYYYTITLNNDLSSPEIKDISFFEKRLKMFICKYDIQIFNLAEPNTYIYEKERKETAIPIYTLKGDDIGNWYFISTTLKKQLHISFPLQIENLNNNRKEILQLIYITPEMIDKYKQMFIDFKTPINFEIKNKIIPQDSRRQPSQIKALTGGGNMKLRRLLKSYNF